MRLSLSAVKTPQLVQVKQAQLELPGGLVKLVGSADLAKKYLDMKIPLCDLDLSKLAKVLPSLREGTGGELFNSKLQLALSLTGNPEQLGSVTAKLDSFKMAVAGGTHIRLVNASMKVSSGMAGATRNWLRRKMVSSSSFHGSSAVRSQSASSSKVERLLGAAGQGSAL